MTRPATAATSVMPAGPRAAVQWRRLSFFKRLISPVAALVIWELVCRLGWVEPQLLPAPTAIVARMIELASAAERWRPFGIPRERLGVGVAIAIVLGVPLGLAAQFSRASAAVLDALVRLMAPIPEIAPARAPRPRVRRRWLDA